MQEIVQSCYSLISDIFKNLIDCSGMCKTDVGFFFGDHNFRICKSIFVNCHRSLWTHLELYFPFGLETFSVFITFPKVLSKAISLIKKAFNFSLDSLLGDFSLSIVMFIDLVNGIISFVTIFYSTAIFIFEFNKSTNQQIKIICLLFSKLNF